MAVRERTREYAVLKPGFSAGICLSDLWGVAADRDLWRPDGLALTFPDGRRVGKALPRSPDHQRRAADDRPGAWRCPHAAPSRHFFPATRVVRTPIVAACAR